MTRFIFLSVAGPVNIGRFTHKPPGWRENSVGWKTKANFYLTQTSVGSLFSLLSGQSAFPEDMLLLHVVLSHPLWSKLGVWQFTLPDTFLSFISVLFSASGKFYIQCVLLVITPSRPKLLVGFLDYEGWEWKSWSFWCHILFLRQSGVTEMCPLSIPRRHRKPCYSYLLWLN